MSRKIIAKIIFGAFLLPLLCLPSAVRAQSESQLNISDNAKRQIAALLADKKQRGALQRVGLVKPAADKMSVALRSAIGLKTDGMNIAAEIPRLADRAERDDKERIAFDITAQATKKLLGTIEQNGGEVFFASAEYGFLQAYLPLAAVEAVATLGEVKRIEFSRKDERIPPMIRQPKEETFLSNLAAGKFLNSSAILTGAVVSEGDAAHRANRARSTFGVTGAGVKVGVISDSVRYLADAQASGDLPGNVNVLPGQSGIQADNSDIGEGTAMLEIIYDLAPGAQLYFATGSPDRIQNPVLFAQNIRALRNAGCKIIVDDLSATYGADGTPFQDTIVASAINDVTASGVLYVTAAGNEGNKNDGTSRDWEGDFTLSGKRFVFGGVDYGEIHDFSPSDPNVTNNVTTSPGGGSYLLWWADTYGGSTVDYDMFLVSPDGSELLAASTDRQNGEASDLPFEGFTPQEAAPLNSQIIVIRYGNAPRRALHLSRVGGTIRYNTDGAIRGHNGAANALSIAATPTGPFLPNGGPQGPFPGVFKESGEPTKQQVERFSRNGPRRIFYNANNTPITPNNFLFSTSGGRLIQKVDFTGADGVSTTLPAVTGLNPFFGTSAAAPHVAAIAALIKSAEPYLNRQQIIQIMTANAIDIESPGRDRDSGWGIVDAYGSVADAK